jgi:hypothetical protein
MFPEAVQILAGQLEPLRDESRPQAAAHDHPKAVTLE